MEETRSQIEIKLTLNEKDAREIENLLVDIDPPHIPVALSLLRDPELFGSLIKTQASLVGSKEIEVRLTPTPLLQFFAS